MCWTKGMWAIVLFNAAYIIGFAVYYISIGNYEFLWYIAVVVFLALLILFTLPKSKFDFVILWGLSIWGLLHMMGGGVHIGDTVLYAFKIFPIFDGGAEFYILKFDQFVHAYGFAVSALVVYHLVKQQTKEGFNKKVLYFVAVIGSMGLGALNEIVEFTAVVVFPETGVGGYYNTALDMVFNGLGAVIGALFIWFRERRLLKTQTL